LAFRHRRVEVCPHCDRALVGSNGEPSALDLRYEELEATQRIRAQQILLWGTPVVVVLAVAMPLIHVGTVVLAPVVAILHLVVLRLYLVRAARRYLGPTRRLFTRWLARFAFLWLGLPGYASMVVPLAGVLGGASTFVALTEVVHVYTAWSLARERGRKPLLGWETVLMAMLATVTVVVVLAAAVGAAVVGWSASAIVDWLQSG
jgi:hypothetical protein